MVAKALCQIERMSQFFNIHSENPQNRLVVQVADCLKQGGVVVYPTDACYAIGCSKHNKP